MPSESNGTARWLNDILHYIELARRFAAGMAYDEFRFSELHVYAVTRCLEIVSEASRRLPAERKARHPAIPWRAMAAAGNVYRHDYEDVAAQRVWETLTTSVPPLRDAIIEELHLLGNSEN